MTSHVGATIRAFIKKRWVKIWGGISGVVLIFLLLLPFGVKFYLLDWLEKNGAEQAAMDWFWYNPLASRITVKGVDLQTGGKSVLRNSKIELDFDLLSLFSHDIHLQKAEYKDFVVDLEQNEDGSWRIGTYRLAGEEKEKGEAADEEHISDWAFLADTVTFSNCSLVLKMNGLNMHVDIQQAELVNFTTRAGGPVGTFFLKGMVNQAPVELKLDSLSMAPSLRVAGSVSMSQLSFADFAPILKEVLQPFSGVAGLDGKLVFTVSEGGGSIIEYDGSLDLADLAVGNSSMAFEAQGVSWQGQVQYETGRMLFDSSGELALAGYELKGRDESIPIVSGGEKLAWQGTVAYGRQKIDESPSLKFDGKLNGEQLSTMLTESGLEFVQGKVGFSTQSNLQLAEELDITGSSSLSLDRFAIIDKANNGSLLSLDNFRITGFEGLGGKKFAIKDISAANLMVSVPGDLPMKIDIPELQLLNVGAEDFSTFTVADLTVKTPVVTATKNGSELLRLQRLALNNIFADTKVNVRADALLIDKVFFFPPTNESVEKSACSLGNARLTDLSWSTEGGLHGGSLTFHDLLATIILDKEKNLNISHALEEMLVVSQEPEEGQDPPEFPEEHPKDTVFSLGEIVVAGESRLMFEDHSTAIPYTTDLAISRFYLGALDSRTPEQQSELIFKGELEERAPLEVGGYLSPFHELPVIQLQLMLKNYPLASLSPYTVQAVGTGLLSGQLQLDTTFALTGDELDMQNTILLKKLKTETISQELAAELDNELPIPLDAALAMLRDKEENITLEIPLSGSLAELNVGISDILITALGKAIVPAASGYLMYALGPYSALAYIGMKVGEKMLEVTLPPVVFGRQESTLTEEHADYLARIAKILEERPAIDLQICPTVGAWEFLSDKRIAAIEEDTIEVKEKEAARLEQLGQERAAAVKNHLAGKYAINESRLLICDTRIDKAKNSVPAVHLNL